MEGFVYYFLIFLLILFSVFITWRMLSQRKSLPCPSWLGFLVEMDNPFTKTNRSHYIIERLYLEKGMKVLDAGCGPGRVTIPIAQEVGPDGEVTAFDMQKEMLSKVKEKASIHHLTNIEYIQGELGHGKLPTNYFDRVLLVTVLGEIVNPQKALKEVYDALKPGGLLCITEVIFDPHFQTKSRVLKLAHDLEFQENETFGHFLAYNLILEKNKRAR